MMEGITELLEALKGKRPEILHLTESGRYSERKREVVYSDADHQYKFMLSPTHVKELSSVRSFCEAIKEELRRLENEDGEKATVKIEEEGGFFIANEDFSDIVIKYKRINSQQWQLIKRNINRVMSHREFLEFVQALKPSIADFQNLFQRLSSIRLIGNSTLCSTPIFVNNQQEEGYKCTYKLEDGYEGEETLPNGFTCNVQFTRAGDNHYEIPIELLFYRNDNDGLEIRVMCPLLENIEEGAIIDEANFIKSNINASRILILSDF